MSERSKEVLKDLQKLSPEEFERKYQSYQQVVGKDGRVYHIPDGIK